MDSILNSVKKLLGIAEENGTFDTDIIIHINSVFMILTQLGVGPKEGFSITDSSSSWSDFVLENKQMEAVKSYMYAKVRLMFDPPSSSVALQSLNNVISELEWRLNVLCDSVSKEETSDESS